MRLSYIAAEAADSLASNMRRAFLAALGLMVGVASVVCVLAAGNGLESLITKEMGSFGRPTYLQVGPNYNYLASIGWTSRPEAFSVQDREEIAGMTDLVSGVSPYANFNFTTSFGRTSSMTKIVCVSADFFPMEKLSLERGRMFNSEDDRTMRLAAILGVNIAEKLFGTPGSVNYVDPIGQRIRIGTFGEVEVVGLLKRESASLMAAIDSYDSTNNGTVFIPFSASNRMGGSVKSFDLRVEAVSVEKVDESNQAILSLLSVNHGNWDGKPKFEIRTGKNAVSEVDKMTSIVTTFIAAVAGISLIVAGIGVMNVMLISVKERTREIGTRKALGARGSWIGRQFLIESLVVCLSGGAAGVLLATLVAIVITHFTFLPAVVPPNTIPLSLILSTAVAFAFGWLPASRASKMDPCEALRHE